MASGVIWQEYHIGCFMEQVKSLPPCKTGRGSRRKRMLRGNGGRPGGSSDEVSVMEMERRARLV